HGLSDFTCNGSASRLRMHEVRICLDLSLHAYPRTTNALGSPILLRPSIASRAGDGRFDPKVIPLGTPVWAWRRHRGTGLSTSCASTTPLGLALAPDLPWED